MSSDAVGTRETDTWDVVVIGAGPVGENAAQYAIQGSERTAVLIEDQLVGGECSYWACMPSKALLRPVEVLSAANALPGVSGARLEPAEILKRRDEIISHRDDAGQVEWASGVGIDVVRGRGRLAGVRSVEVTAADGSVRTIQARQAVILATGTTAAIPPVPGLAQARPWISRDATNLVEVPGRVAIIGGGVVGCEAATWLSALGAEVTIIQSGQHLLPRNEPFAHELVSKRFAEGRRARADRREGGAGRARRGRRHGRRQDPRRPGHADDRRRGPGRGTRSWSGPGGCPARSTSASRRSASARSPSRRAT
jgi:pyruvate/2-oxoglutarate dehydrogenase complex dihydrolipoamide dehydrogenase (E3) component